MTRADVLGDAFTTALNLAANGSSEKISAFLPGNCDSALSIAVRRGMRITFPMLLMASPGYDDWKQYLPATQVLCDEVASHATLHDDEVMQSLSLDRLA